MLYPMETSTRRLIPLGGYWQLKEDAGEGLSERWFEATLTKTTPIAIPAVYPIDLFF